MDRRRRGRKADLPVRWGWGERQTENLGDNEILISFYDRRNRGTELISHFIQASWQSLYELLHFHLLALGFPSPP